MNNTMKHPVPFALPNLPNYDIYHPPLNSKTLLYQALYWVARFVLCLSKLTISSLKTDAGFSLFYLSQQCLGCGWTQLVLRKCTVALSCLMSPTRGELSLSPPSLPTLPRGPLGPGLDANWFSKEIT